VFANHSKEHAVYPLLYWKLQNSSRLTPQWHASKTSQILQLT